MNFVFFGYWWPNPNHQMCLIGNNFHVSYCWMIDWKINSVRSEQGYRLEFKMYIANCYDFYVYRRVNGKLVLSVCVFATHRLAPSSLGIPSFQVCSEGSRARVQSVRKMSTRLRRAGHFVLFRSVSSSYSDQDRSPKYSSRIRRITLICPDRVATWRWHTPGPADRPEKFHPDYLRCGAVHRACIECIRTRVGSG